MSARTSLSCTPENRLCGGDGEVGPVLMAQLTGCGVECRGELTEVLVDNGQCGMPGAVLEEIAQRLVRAGVAHSFDRALRLTDKVLEGTISPAVALADPASFVTPENPAEGRLYADPC